MVSIARKNLFEDIPRFLVAQAGIMFAVSLVTIQTGILQGFSRSTTLLINQSNADIWVVSQDFVNLDLTSSLLLKQATDAADLEGVKIAEPVVTSPARWRVQGKELTSVRLYGFLPQGQLFVPGDTETETIQKLENPYTAIIEQSNLNSLHLNQKEHKPKISSLPVQVVGTTRNAQSIVSGAFVFTSLQTAQTYIKRGFSPSINCQLQNGELNCQTLYQQEDSEQPQTAPSPDPLSSTDPIHYILIQAEPDTNLETLKQRLQENLAGTQAYTSEEIALKVRTYWQQRTGIGFILGLGAVVGVIVGVVIVGQILYSSVSDHLKEFGTLKAMGASNPMIYGIIIEQALYMAILGYLPGILLCWGLSQWAMATQGILILINPLTALSVLGITMSMCVGSALFAIQKVTHVDPIIVFKA
ncbi:FtsX-like permease family protein [Spirulina sp. CS-785/01]|uniref:FtsX-like permease family protein n=1 Tax=Spirulina sp. CS-785/01 TaxID=3021716 RepID=UPI003FA6C010